MRYKHHKLSNGRVKSSFPPSSLAQFPSHLPQNEATVVIFSILLENIYTYLCQYNTFNFFYPFLHKYEHTILISLMNIFSNLEFLGLNKTTYFYQLFISPFHNVKQQGKKESKLHSYYYNIEMSNVYEKGLEGNTIIKSQCLSDEL